jgi:hypothetical protein
MSYQQSRRLGGDARVGAEFSASASSDDGPREYAKKGKAKYPSGMNVSFARTRPINDLEDIKALGEGKPPKSGVTDKQLKSKLKGA